MSTLRATDDMLVSYFDYVYNKGQLYKVCRDDYDGDLLLKPVDEVPEEYWQRWDDD